ncbi:MAG: hypothetical protein ACI8TX_001037 [Hyphomicrobiaceae bacterium]|jgi:hypothetical protein
MQTTQTQQAVAKPQSNNGPMMGGPPSGGNFLLTPSLMDYVAPDLTLPEQFFGSQKCDDGMGPERALMYAVLKDGIRSFYKNVGATRRKYKKIYAEAEEWISEESWDDPFSFRTICDTLGIDARCLRTRLFAWCETELLRREKTGDTASVQVGRSPFPTPIDLDDSSPTHSSSTHSSSTQQWDESDGDLDSGDENSSWSENEHVSLDDFSNQELVYAA